MEQNTKKEIEYGGFLRNIDTGEEELLFTCYASELLCRNRTIEKGKFEAEHSNKNYDIDSVKVRYRKAVIRYGPWWDDEEQAVSEFEVQAGTWYTEKWTDFDLMDALETLGIEQTAENIDRAKSCLTRDFIAVFTSNSDRRVMLENAVRKLFEGPAPVTLKDLQPGDRFRKDDQEYIVCEQLPGETAVLQTSRSEKAVSFGESPDWRRSPIRNYLNVVELKKVERTFGKENIPFHNVSLISLAGETDYKTVGDKVSILSLSRFQKYRETIEYLNLGDEWLLTPDSIRGPGKNDKVLCLALSGNVVGCECWKPLYLRPFFHLINAVKVEKVI